MSKAVAADESGVRSQDVRLVCKILELLKLEPNLVRNLLSDSGGVTSVSSRTEKQVSNDELNTRFEFFYIHAIGIFLVVIFSAALCRH